MHKLTSVFGAAAVLAASAAFAQGADPNPGYPQQQTPSTTPATEPSGEMDHKKMAGDEFKSLDQNGDGKISKDEIPSGSALADQFSTLDTDKDGALSKKEFRKHHE
jgi:hypothetical protein